MPPHERDAAYLWDMVEAGERIASYTQGLTVELYLRDQKTCDAVERNLEVIGEAWRRLSDDFKQAHSEIPWRKIIGLRNILVHDYERVDDKEIWAVATMHVPDFITKLKPLIPPLPPEQDA